MSSQTIERMVVEVEGQGEAVILVHGLGGTSNSFTPQLSVLSGRFRSVRPDLPGSGRSPLAEGASLEGFADRLIRMAGVLGIERAHFVGHSLGTIVCQQVALREPRLVRSLALFGPLSAPPDQARQGLKDRARKARAEGMAEIADAIVQAATATATRQGNPVAVAFVRESLMRQPPEGYAATCEALSAVVAPEAARIACPTLLVTGEDDAVAPPSVARALAERITGARVQVLPRCGHWTTIEAAEACNALLKEFLSLRT